MSPDLKWRLPDLLEVELKQVKLALVRAGLQPLAETIEREAVPAAVAVLDGWADILEAVRREMAAGRGTHRGNCPAHGHSEPGVWDSDNGELAGKKCALCLMWNMAASMLAASPQAPADQAQELPALCGWQPIETAPKDGTRIIIFADAYFVAGWGRIDECDCDGWIIVNDVWCPAHMAKLWMPLVHVSARSQS